ncbi:MAG: hypothetical protein LBU70_10060, partial [Chitinispirillales bacterium]|nr:hypothetical protein [Chitinispirillales bacterium]
QLKATESLWNGTDDYDFSALPGGNRGTSGTFWNVDALGFWWSATETNATYTPSRYMSSTNSIVYRINLDKWSGFSLRCINDNAP